MVVAILGHRRLASAAAWTVLFSFEKGHRALDFGMEVDFELDVNFWMAMFFVPLFWWAVHALMGMYADVRRRHRGLEVRQVTRASAMGGVLLFFALLLDDVTTTHIDHYETLGVWLTTHASLVLLGRWC